MSTLVQSVQNTQKYTQFHSEKHFFASNTAKFLERNWPPFSSGPLRRAQIGKCFPHFYIFLEGRHNSQTHTLCGVCCTHPEGFTIMQYAYQKIHISNTIMKTERLVIVIIYHRRRSSQARHKSAGDSPGGGYWGLEGEGRISISLRSEVHP